MLKVGLTGGIGSGKSTVSKMLAELGAYIFDADTEAKKILADNSAVQNELIAEFGTDILNPEDTIDRAKLARIAFQDEDHQLRLNAIIHPFVSDKFDHTFDKVTAAGKHSMLILDAALIYEAGLDPHMDYVIVVSSSMGLRIARALKRGTLSREQVLRRMDLQWTDEEKTSMADYVIRNNSTEEELEKQVQEVYNQLV